jgi:hypothetical protein
VQALDDLADELAARILRERPRQVRAHRGAGHAAAADARAARPRVVNPVRSRIGR